MFEKPIEPLRFFYFIALRHDVSVAIWGFSDHVLVLDGTLVLINPPRGRDLVAVCDLSVSDLLFGHYLKQKVTKDGFVF